MKKYYLLVVVAALNFTLAYASSDLRSKVEEASSGYLSNHFMNGAYMFCDEEGVIVQGAKGIRSLVSGQLLQAAEQMPIASATKTITAAAILRLQDKGLLNVQDTVAKHLTLKSGIWRDNKLPSWADKLKIHDLLTHRSGLPEYFMAIELDVKKPQDEINKDIANFAGSHELAFEPSSKHNYSNTNFILLGLIIEQVSGKKLGQFYDQEFFVPLGMHNTKLISVADAVQLQVSPELSSLPTRYFVTPTEGTPEFIEAKTKSLMVPFADGGVASTTRDLIKWQKALHSGKVLSVAALNMMKTKHYEVDSNAEGKNYMGYGLYILELENGDIVYHHGGSAVAIRSETGCIPAKGIYYAILSNVTVQFPKEMQGKVDFSKLENQLDIKHFKQHMLEAIR